jgi:hypothetical protein
MTPRSSGPLALAIAAGLLALATAFAVNVTTIDQREVVLETREFAGGIEEIRGYELTTTVDRAMVALAVLLLLIAALCLAGAVLLALRRSRVARRMLIAAGALAAVAAAPAVGSPDAIVLAVLVVGAGLLAVAAGQWARGPRPTVADVTPH